MGRRWRSHFLFLLILALLMEPVMPRRGGGGIGRGSSAGRSGGLGRSRGGGGWSSGSAGRQPNTGGSGGGGLFNRGGNSQPNYGGNSGWNNQQQQKSGGGFFGSSSRQNPKPSYNKGSGLGSMVRSNTFKNAIVGAAAGYLTYQAGKHIIRSAMAPMMWNNRQYYWGQNYYQPRMGQSMCRMPVDSHDQQFGNVYFSDQTRPREIVWGCGYGEVCCGYECCPSQMGYGGGGGYGQGGGWWGRNGGYGGIGVGSLLILLLLSICGCALAYKICNRANQNQYQPGNQAPPQYY